MPLETALDVLWAAACLCVIGACVVGLGVAAAYVVVVLPLRFLATYTITKIKSLGRKN
jgi:hypothetical protein